MTGASRTPIYWDGSTPTHCDWCGSPLTTRFYDTNAVLGTWGRACPTCFITAHGQLGIAHGQCYDLQPYDGDPTLKWLKTAG